MTTPVQYFLLPALIFCFFILSMFDLNKFSSKFEQYKDEKIMFVIFLGYHFFRSVILMWLFIIFMIKPFTVEKPFLYQTTQTPNK